MKYFFGFSYWKHPFVEPFFDDKFMFINTLFEDPLKKALRKGMNPHSSIYIWGKKHFPSVEEYASRHQINIYRVEDGFIRSVGLGSDLTQPYSLVIDSRGIYFDPTQESDLEYLLQNHLFSAEELTRAKKIRDYLVQKKLSKYNLYDNVNLNLPKNKKIILVPGQVDDDASIKFGAPKMSNLILLKQVHQNNPESYIVYKPHPDVLADNRTGNIDDTEALKYCNRIVSEVGIDSILSYADEVHTMTSLVGFESIMRGIKVITYGMPFYAGWGLSEDKQICERRKRQLRIDELVAGVYLLYPHYIDPITKKQCEIEKVLDFVDKERGTYRHSTLIYIRNWFIRKTQILIRTIKGI